jgi:TolB-like protein/DNA-binding winged helix-turn-helix (wHTH) protein
VGSARATASGPRTIFEFADLTFDTRQRAVFREARRIPLQALTYRLLLALVEAAPSLLTHDDLVERVWRARFVTSETVSQRVLLLRRALGDDARNPRYVRGIRGLGYQLVPSARALINSAQVSPPRTAADSERLDCGPSLAGEVDLSLPTQPSIVILPFDADDDEEHRNLARGLTHDIMTRIGRTRSFFVIARGSAFSFGQGAHDVRDVARKLGVRYVVQGNVQFHGAELSVNVALADGVEGREVWAENFHRKLEYVFETQEEITDLIVGSISSEVELAEQRNALLETPANLNAWSAYHRGCWHMYRFTPADYEHAQRFFELSASLDPSSSRALAGLSFVHWQRAFLEISRDRPREIQRALEVAQQSVSVNPRDPLAHWALGRAYLLRGEVNESLPELRAATGMNPSFAVGQYTLGFALMHAGETAGGIEMADKARRLSPYDPMGFAMIGLRGFSLALAGEYEQAAKTMATSIRQPNAHYHMVAMAAVCDVLAEREGAARRDLARLRAARPTYGASDFLRAFQLQRPEHTKLVASAFRRLERLRVR